MLPNNASREPNCRAGKRSGVEEDTDVVDDVVVDEEEEEVDDDVDSVVGVGVER